MTTGKANLVSLVLLATGLCAVDPAGAQITFLRSIGGTANGQFNGPYGITVDSSGNVWVADTYNSRIQEFNSGGQFLQAFGDSGSGNGQIFRPFGIAVAPSGNVWVADTYNNRIQEFSSSGAWLKTIGDPHIFQGDGYFTGPYGITVDASGNVWVADTYNNRIQEFSANGDFLQAWASHAGVLYPSGVVVGASGNVWIAGENLEKSGSGVDECTGSGRWVRGISGDSYAHALGITADSLGNIWVVGTLGFRIQEYNSNGDLLQSYGKLGQGDGQLNSPRGIAVDSSGNIWVADTGNNRIVEFSIPEPGTIALLALGGLALLRRKKDRHRGLGPGQ